MKAANIRAELHQFIDSIEDRKVEAIYILFENEINITDQRKKLIQSERTRFLNGEGESLNWETVKDMALNKNKRRAI